MSGPNVEVGTAQARLSADQATVLADLPGDKSRAAADVYDEQDAEGASVLELVGQASLKITAR